MTNNIAIITGGVSSERDVSLQTADAVSNSLERSNIRHEVFTITDFKELLNLDLSKFTRVFLALHGGFGENGMAQSYLEALGIPYNGPSPQTSAICMDKLLTKHVAQGLGISVANYMYFKTKCTVDFQTVQARLGNTCIVKPNREGCSFGVSLIRGNSFDFLTAINRAEENRYSHRRVYHWARAFSKLLLWPSTSRLYARLRKRVFLIRCKVHIHQNYGYTCHSR